MINIIQGVKVEFAIYNIKIFLVTVYFIDKPRDVLAYIDKNDILFKSSDINKLWKMDCKKNILKAVNEIMKEVK